jgi:hypothetical protein
MKPLGPAPDFTQRWHPPALLLAAFPSETEDVDLAQTLEIEEAVLSFARAALAQGRKIALPADRVVAPLVSQVAGEYGPTAVTEAGDGSPALVKAMFTEGRDPRLEQALAAGGQVELGQLAVGKVEISGVRHRLTPAALEWANPERAVVIGEPPALLDELELVREFGVEIATVGPTLSARDIELGNLREHDTVAPMLDEKLELGEGEADELRLPYAFLMQELVWSWSDEEWETRR